jgi:G3E family GTPase
MGLSRTEEKMVEMSNGCICCTLRDDLLQEVRQLAECGRFDYLLIESTGISEPMPIAATFDFRDDAGRSLNDVAVIDTMVTVVDALNILSDFGSTEALADRGETAGDSDERRLVDLLVEQIEFANVVVISKADLVTPAQLRQVHALVRALNAEAEVVEAVRGEVPLARLLGTGSFDLTKAEDMPRWAQELEGVHASEADTYGIESFVYRASAPFHPGRLHELLERDKPGLLRFKGYFWLATRPDWIGCLSGAGQMCQVEPMGRWWAAVPRDEWPDDAESVADIEARWREPHGDRQQEIVWIGQHLDQVALTRALDRCLLTDEEAGQGPAGWRQLADPFPAWSLMDAPEVPA